VFCLVHSPFNVEKTVVPKINMVQCYLTKNILSVLVAFVIFVEVVAALEYCPEWGVMKTFKREGIEKGRVSD
jgi:hypothetical protein